MTKNENYLPLARHLDTFPQGFPQSASGSELDLLAYLFSPEEAEFATHLSWIFTPLDRILETTTLSLSESKELTRSMARKGLINMIMQEGSIQLRLLPFIVGFYENQNTTMDETLAQLFETYYKEAAFDLLSVKPQFHRVIPINETIESKIEILPEVDVKQILSNKRAWAVTDCVCRKQKALIGDGCEHPIRMCLIMSDTPGVFEGRPGMDALTLEGAMEVLDQAAAAGLVHTVSNNKGDIDYICNCCTCSCGILRGIAEAHIANVVARSAYYASVDQMVCVGCGICYDQCQFGAIEIDETAVVNTESCVGCGICAHFCPEGAISLTSRPVEEVLPVPLSFKDWIEQRNLAKSMD